MNRLTVLFLLGALIGTAEEITLTNAAMLRAERSVVSLKAGTVVELLSRDENTLTVRYHKLTGTIPASSLVATETRRRKSRTPALPRRPGGPKRPTVRPWRRPRRTPASTTRTSSSLSTRSWESNAEPRSSERAVNPKPQNLTPSVSLCR
ncbi:MAG: hypothetical protein EXS42_05650 [Lacunisphaera sp.]|nr:hypothetical protein [Lacunisphaera sp.]